MAAVILDQAQDVEKLKAPNMAILIARRDLVWLQQFFAALDNGRVMDYTRLQKAVTFNLNALTHANGSSNVVVSKDSESST